MTNNELLMRLNAQMYGTLQQCAAAIDAYFDGLAEDHCESFIDPAIGALVNSTLNDVERATEEDAHEFFDAARRRARDPLGYNQVEVPQPPDVTFADLEAGAKIIHDANARETEAAVVGALESILDDIKAQFPEAHVRVVGFERVK